MSTLLLTQCVTQSHSYPEELFGKARMRFVGQTQSLCVHYTVRNNFVEEGQALFHDES